MRNATGPEDASSTLAYGTRAPAQRPEQASQSTFNGLAHFRSRLLKGDNHSTQDDEYAQ
jgi:hypothetical protein